MKTAKSWGPNISRLKKKLVPWLFYRDKRNDYSELSSFGLFEAVGGVFLLMTYVILTVGFFEGEASAFAIGVATAVRIFMVSAVILLRRWICLRQIRICRAALYFYPLFFYNIYCYWEMRSLVHLVTPRFRDFEVAQAEEALFGGVQPSLVLRELLSSRIVGDGLFLVYLSYMLMLPISGLIMFFSGSLEKYNFFLDVVVTTYLSCLAISILHPVSGPWWYFEKELPSPDAVGIYFSHIAYSINQHGASLGTAFPSTHNSVSWAITMVYALHKRTVGFPMVFYAMLISLATIFGQFHYLLDAMVGIAIAAIVFSLLALCIAAHEPKHDQKKYQKIETSSIDVYP
eukprot:GHVO01011057.1.p1 GENE.GHVO01011057.1~~GHVO01011057.1.p1  ORF type:complete len:344 (+),score=8.72 GHVO01011057.1:28-1059(+)